MRYEIIYSYGIDDEYLSETFETLEQALFKYEDLLNVDELYEIEVYENGTLIYWNCCER